MTAKTGPRVQTQLKRQIVISAPGMQDNIVATTRKDAMDVASRVLTERGEVVIRIEGLK